MDVRVGEGAVGRGRCLGKGEIGKWMLGLVRALLGEGGQAEGAVWRGRTGRGRCLARADRERALFWGRMELANGC